MDDWKKLTVGILNYNDKLIIGQSRSLILTTFKLRLYLEDPYFNLNKERPTRQHLESLTTSGMLDKYKNTL
jgi:hypothetical protein